MRQLFLNRLEETRHCRCLVLEIPTETPCCVVLIQLPHSLPQALAGGLDTAALFDCQSQFVRRTSYMSFDITLGKPAGKFLDRMDPRQDALEILMRHGAGTFLGWRKGSSIDPLRQLQIRKSPAGHRGAPGRTRPAGFSNVDYYLVDGAGHVTLSKDAPTHAMSAVSKVKRKVSHSVRRQRGRRNRGH